MHGEKVALNKGSVHATEVAMNYKRRYARKVARN